MEFEEILKLADDLVFQKTGKHLDYLQQAVLEGTLHKRKYADIAEDCHVSEGHLKDIGADLWGILSELLECNVSKKTFPAVIENSTISSSFNRDCVGIRNFKIINTPFREDRETTEGTGEKQKFYLEFAPKVGECYAREAAIAQLETAFFDRDCKIVGIFGLPGIGKTTLSLTFAREFSDRFDCIIYRSLKFAPRLGDFIKELLNLFAVSKGQGLAASLTASIERLQQNRCLLILDDYQELFDRSQLSGVYLETHQDYQDFLNLLLSASCQSHVILNSSQQFINVSMLEKQGLETIKLNGLSSHCIDLLDPYQLSDRLLWENLIETYQGHPRWLEHQAQFVRELFGGNLSQFVAEKPLILSDACLAELKQLLDRLTPVERQVAVLLDEDVKYTLTDILDRSPFPVLQTCHAVRSLNRRFILNKVGDGDETYFVMNATVRQFIRVAKLSQ